MKAYEIRKKEMGWDDVRVVAYENLLELEKEENIENCEVEELCEVEPACLGVGEGYFIKNYDEMCSGDYVFADGNIIGDESHSGQGMSQGEIDIERTNKDCLKNGFNKFQDWEFDFLVGSYWDGNNWKIVVIQN